MSWADLRKEYALQGLAEADLAADPFAQFQSWLDQAIAAELPEPNAMLLATATPDDAQAILSHKVRPLTEADVAIEAGKRNFARFGCAGCHGTELEGGLANPNAQGGQVPSLLHLSDDYTKDEILAVIRNGRASPLENASGPTPPLYMPAWKSLLSDEDIHQVVEFLWSRQQKAKAGW